MLRKILVLQGVQQLNSTEQKRINGGSVPDRPIQCEEWNALGAMTYAQCLSYRPLEIQYANGNCKVFGPLCASNS